MAAQANHVLAGNLKVLYRKHRTALLNKKYYGIKLARLRKKNNWMEWVIAVGVTGSSASGWAIWDIEPWFYLWAVIAAGSSLLAIAKPILKYSDDIERYTKLFSGYSQAYTQLSHLVDQVTKTHSITVGMEKAYDEVTEIIANLAYLDDPAEDEKLKRRYFEEVLVELPVGRYWIPNN